MYKVTALSNASTKGLGWVFRSLLILAEFTCLSFSYALLQIFQPIFYIFGCLSTVGTLIFVIFIETTLKNDDDIRYTHKKTNNKLPVWTFVRFVFLGTSFYLIVFTIYSNITNL